MRILFLLTQDLESPAGVGRYFPWARGLARLGHQVSIAALHASYDTLNQTRFWRDDVEVHYVAQMHVRKQDNRKIYYPAHRLLTVAAQATWALSRAALHIPADVIHVGKPHPMNSLAGLIASTAQHKPLLLDCDDLEVATSHFGGRWQRWGVAFFEKNMPRRAQYVSTHTFFLRDYLLSLGVPEQRIVYIPNGVDYERFAGLDATKVEALRRELGLIGKKVIAFIGSLSLPSHPIDLLLQAFQRVHTVIPEALLLIVGGGEEYERLVKQTQVMGLGEAVRFCGRIPGAEVPAYYRLADVLVDPVFDDAVGRSRLPLKLFESWVSGVPFATADVGDRRMVLGSPPAGVIARPGDPQSLAEEILRVLSDPDLAATLRQRGLRRAEEYSWERLAQRMETIYQKALAERG